MSEFKTVIGYTNYEINREGELYNKKTNIRLVGSLHQGYIRVNITNDFTKKSQKRFMHRIVAETFLENPNECEQIDHIDNNKRNNNVENLRWCSNSQNQTNKQKIIYKNNNPKSIHKFVSWCRDRNNWRGSIRVNNKVVFICRGDNDEELYIICLKKLYELRTVFELSFYDSKVKQDLIKYKIMEPFI